MKPARLIVVSLFALLIGIPAAAQDGYPLPENLPAITPDNAAQVTEIARVGGVLPGALAWSPDGNILAAGTSEGVKLYDSDNLTAAPRQISAGEQDVLFNPDGTILVSGGQLWNTHTGKSIATIGESDERLFSPTGNILVTSHFEDGQTRVYLWTVRGKPLGTLDTGSELIFNGAVFNADESLIAVELMSSDTFYHADYATVQLWDVQTGQQRGIFQGAYELIDQVKFVSNGGYLLLADSSSAIYGSYSGEIRIWDVRTGRLAKLIDEADNPQINAKSNWLVLNQNDRLELTNLYDWQTSTLMQERLTFNWDAPGSPNFSPNGRWLAASGEKFLGDISAYIIALWDIRTSTVSAEPDAELVHENPVRQYSFSPDSRLIAVYEGSQIDIWDIQQRKRQLIIQPEFSQSSSQVALSIDPSNRYLAIRQADMTELWDMVTGLRLGHMKIPTGTTFSPQLSQAAFWENGRIHVLNLDTETDMRLTVIDDFYGRAETMNAAGGKAAFLGDGFRVFDLATGEEYTHRDVSSQHVAFNVDGTQWLTWDTVPSNSGQSALSLMTPSQSQWITTLQNVVVVNPNGTVFSPDGRLLAVNEFEWNVGYVIRLYDVRTGKLVAGWRKKRETSYARIVFTPDSRYVVVVSRDFDGFIGGERRVNFWDVRRIMEQEAALGTQGVVESFKPTSVLTLYAGESGQMDGAVFSPDGLQMAIGMDDAALGDGISHGYQVYLFQTADILKPNETTRLETLQPVVLEGMYDPRFSPDGKLLLTNAAEDIDPRTDTFKLWDTMTGELLASGSSTGAAAFNPKGDVLVSDNKGTLSFWDVNKLAAGDTQPIATLDTHSGTVQQVAFSADGTRIYARWYGGVIVYAVAHED